MHDDATIRRAIVALLSARSPTASVCPSEVARALEPRDAAWRALMPRVRQVAASLAEAGIVGVTQGDRAMASDEVVRAASPVRLRRGPQFPVEF